MGRREVEAGGHRGCLPAGSHAGGGVPATGFDVVPVDPLDRCCSNRRLVMLLEDRSRINREEREQRSEW